MKKSLIAIQLKVLLALQARRAFQHPMCCIATLHTCKVQEVVPFYIIFT